MGRELFYATMGATTSRNLKPLTTRTCAASAKLSGVFSPFPALSAGSCPLALSG